MVSSGPLRGCAVVLTYAPCLAAATAGACRSGRIWDVLKRDGNMHAAFAGRIESGKFCNEGRSRILLFIVYVRVVGIKSNITVPQSSNTQYQSEVLLCTG